MQIFQCNRTILTSCQVFFDQIAFAVNLSSISSYDISSCINIVNSVFLSSVLIMECSTILIHICSNKHLSFFIDGKLCHLFFIFHCNRWSLSCDKFYICCCCIYNISLWCCNFFKVYRILRFDNCYGRSSIFICFRHLCNQIFTFRITIYAKYSAL